MKWNYARRLKVKKKNILWLSVCQNDQHSCLLLNPPPPPVQFVCRLLFFHEWSQSNLLFSYYTGLLLYYTTQKLSERYSYTVRRNSSGMNPVLREFCCLPT